MSEFIKKNLPGVITDKRTTISGIIAATMIVLRQVGFYFDDDPATVMSVDAIVSAIAILWMGVNAKDAGKF